MTSPPASGGSPGRRERTPSDDDDDSEDTDDGTEDDTDEDDAPDEVVPGEVELQGSWSAGKIVVWASGRGRAAESHDEVSARLEAVGAAPVGWGPHPPVRLPGGATADTHAIALRDALGWLVSLGTGHRSDEVGASLRWLGRIAYEGVRLTAGGRSCRRSGSARVRARQPASRPR